MKLSRRGASEESEVEVVETADQPVNLGKGRPTPKRRDAEGRRGPVTAPKTRKEAYARQKQLTREQKAARASAKPRSVAEQRAALRRGDPSALPRRDQGPTRKLARDYVDSKRMFSNYLLFLFPLFIASYAIPLLSPITIVLFIGFVVEWFVVGRRIRAMAIERFGKAEGSAMGIGFYAGSRAYLPRRWRLPAPQVERGQDF